MILLDEVVRMRKLFGITGEDIADEMSTTKQTVSNIESGKSDNTMSIRFYRLTVLDFIKRIDPEKKQEVLYSLNMIIKHLNEA